MSSNGVDVAELVIFGSCFAYNDDYANHVYPTWLRCLERVEDLSQARLLMVDSGSDVDWERVFPCDAVVHRSRSDDLFTAPDPGVGNLCIVSFRSNPGHPRHGLAGQYGRDARSCDGAGRALCEGLHLAKQWGAKYAAHVESDLFLFGHQVISQ